MAQGIEQTTAKVLRRVKRFHEGQSMRALAGRPLIVVDDGIASGFTLHVAVQALKNNGGEGVMIAAPTGQWDAVLRLAEEVAVVYCANIRAGWGFAVAEAYEHWAEVSEDEVIERLGRLPAYSGKTD